MKNPKLMEDKPSKFFESLVETSRGNDQLKLRFGTFEHEKDGEILPISPIKVRDDSRVRIELDPQERLKSKKNLTEHCEQKNNKIDQHHTRWQQSPGKAQGKMETSSLKIRDPKHPDLIHHGEKERDFLEVFDNSKLNLKEINSEESRNHQDSGNTGP